MSERDEQEEGNYSDQENSECNITNEDLDQIAVKSLENFVKINNIDPG